MALDKGATVGQYVKWLMEVMGASLDTPIMIFVDNKSTIDISSNPVQPGRNVHIHARYFYVRDLINAGDCTIQHLPSKMQIADVLCTFKDVTNFTTLYPLVLRPAIVEMREGQPHWNTSLMH